MGRGKVDAGGDSPSQAVVLCYPFEILYQDKHFVLFGIIFTLTPGRLHIRLISIFYKYSLFLILNDVYGVNQKGSENLPGSFYFR